MKRSQIFAPPTPTWIFSREAIARAVSGARSAMRSDFGASRSCLAYSVKTNPEPCVLAEARALGCMAEVVSEREWDLALSCGFTPETIVYNGPLKTRRSFCEAIKAGATVNIDSSREITWLSELSSSDPSFTASVGLRVSVPASLPGDSDPSADGLSRFGFSYESGELSHTLGLLGEIPGVSVVGLHAHRTSLRPRRAAFYGALTRYLLSLADSCGLLPSLQWLDLGGGFSPTLPGQPAFSAYTRAIARELEQSRASHFRIILEPGRALVGPAFSLVTSVTDTRLSEQSLLNVTTDGSRLDIDPFFRAPQPEFRIAYSPDLPAPDNRPVAAMSVGGRTCIDIDRLLSLPSSRPVLMPGDRIVYPHAGAYTLALTPDFITRRPPVMVISSPGSLPVPAPSSADC